MIDGVLIGLAVLCVGYFIVIVLYAGIETSFAFIWLFFAALLIFLVYGKWYYCKNRERIPQWVPVSIVTSCLAGVAVMVVLCLQVFAWAAAPEEKDLDYVIVLGARVKEHAVSNSLRKRLDKAVEYAQGNPETVLVLSGGRGADEPVSEARAMYDYLVYNGVRKEQLLLEEYSVSTVENIAYSRIVIERHKKKEREEAEPLFFRTAPRDREGKDFVVAADKPLEIGILTSNFHVYRACMIAEKRGFENVYGISASSDPVLFVHLCVRECASILKDRLVGNM